jgi:hypothetical protein
MPDENGRRSVVEESVSQTFQTQVTEDPLTQRSASVHILSWLTQGGSLIPGWWSKSRDYELRKLWKTNDHLAGAMYTFQAKMTAIPFRIVPKDPSNREHVDQAEEYLHLIKDGAQWGKGWQSFCAPFIEDLSGQDNGAFAEIIGPGNPVGPLMGRPTTIAHLDSQRCTRTSNPIFPVLYQDKYGDEFKLHYTRVIEISQMPSASLQMNGVGFCSISRAVNIAQTLLDILTYKQEKLGSRPARTLGITRGGLDPEDVKTAFATAETEMDALGLKRYSKFVLAGSNTIPEAGIDLLDLASLPDGFDEETSILLGMAGVALAFGMDARELFPMMGGGATRADAMLQHLKQRGKGPGQTLEAITHQFNWKFLPPHLDMIFDFQDDAEDRQAADIRKTRADKRTADLGIEATNIRVERELMVANGEITQQQFERMELENGRLEDGVSVLSLFFVKTGEISRLLDMGVDNPLTATPEEIAPKIKEQRAKIYEEQAVTKTFSRRWEQSKALAALDELERLAQEQSEQQAAKMGQEVEMQAKLGKMGGPPGQDMRLRRVNLASPTARDAGQMLSTDTDTTSDDDVKELDRGVGIDSLSHPYWDKYFRS